MSDDPRIDPLGASAILTNTQFRFTFAPADAAAKVTALKLEVRADKLAQMAALLAVGDVHVQLKAGFAPERHIVITPAEIIVLMDMMDKFITELPRARAAKPIEDDAE
jgi:hypothetical protein